MQIRMSAVRQAWNSEVQIPQVAIRIGAHLTLFRPLDTFADLF